MPLFHVAVREHTYTGRFYSEAVQAESPEEALLAAAERAVVPLPPTAPVPQPVSGVAATGRTPTGWLDTDGVQASRHEDAPQATAALRPPPGPTPQGFSVVVREQADTGPVYSEVVQAGSAEEALQVAAGQVAAGQVAAPEPPPDPGLSAETAGRPRCADVWVYALLHCELEAGHDSPHMAVAHRYGRSARWVRDDRGIAHAVPGPAADAPVSASIVRLSPVPEPGGPRAPFTGTGS